MITEKWSSTRLYSKNKQLSSVYRASALVLSSLLSLMLLTACSYAGNGQGDLSGNMLIVGSTALQPLATQAALSFQKQHPQVHIQVQGGGSLFGLNEVTTKASDIGDSDVYADPAAYPDANLTDHIVCVIPFTLVVNQDVPLTTLTQEEIIGIFATHTIHNWRQVGGPELPIVPVVRPHTSGTRATFLKYVLGGYDENDTGAVKIPDSSNEVLKTVARLSGAIGYLALSVLNNSVRPVAINGFKPDIKEIEAGTYKFWNYEHMYTMGDSNPIVSKFLNYMISKPMQLLAQQMKYISIQDMKLPAIE